MSTSTKSKRGAVLTGADVLTAMQSTSTASRSKRKPFSVGARVERIADGERGIVESVETWDNDTSWLVSVKLDSTNSGASGRQLTAARGEWAKVAADDADNATHVAVTGHELSEEELAQEADALHATEEQLAQEAARLDELDAREEKLVASIRAERAQMELDAQEEQERTKSAQKRAQGFVCTFPECVVHSK